MVKVFWSEIKWQTKSPVQKSMYVLYVVYVLYDLYVLHVTLLCLQHVMCVL